MASILKFPLELQNVEQQYGVFDDFVDDQSDTFWVDVISDTGTAAVGDAVNGVMVLTAGDGTVADNDEVYLHTANEIFKFAADTPMLGKARIQFTETASGVYNAMVGFMNAMGADSLINDAGGPKVSGSTAVIYKVDGGTVWRCATANNSVSTDSISSTSSTATGYQVLEIEVTPDTSTTVKVHFRVDGVPLKDATTELPIVHTVTVASATEMHFGFGAKLGAATNNDVLNVDYAGAWAKRV